MCENKLCLKEKCSDYKLCWFLKIKCYKCGNKIDVRECKKSSKDIIFENKEYFVQEIVCPICNINIEPILIKNK